jgi:predicted nucleotidyltransferase
MNDTVENHRHALLDGLRRFVDASRNVAGVRRIALVGSIVTAKPDPKDIDVLVVVADEADLAPLALHARRLQGHAQSFNRGADVFLASEAPPQTVQACQVLHLASLYHFLPRLRRGSRLDGAKLDSLVKIPGRQGS